MEDSSSPCVPPISNTRPLGIFPLTGGYSLIKIGKLFTELKPLSFSFKVLHSRNETLASLLLIFWQACSAFKLASMLAEVSRNNPLKNAVSNFTIKR